MSKPNFKQLTETPDKYVKEVVEVEVYRDVETNNVYFVPDDEDVVLDGFIVLTDQSGVVFQTRQKDIAEKLSVFLRRGATGILGTFSKLGMPVGVLTGLIEAVSGRSKKAAGVVEALRRAQSPGGLPIAVADLMRVVGPRKWRKALDKLAQGQNKIPKEAAEQALIELVTDKLIKLLP